MIEIRPATPADARALAELRWEFRAGKTPPTEAHEAFVARCASWMSAELERGAWRAWVADESGRIIGQIWLQLLSKLPNPAAERERHAYVSNVYVTPTARGGIGTRLLQTAIDWAAANDVDRVVLWPTARSRSLYRRHGFVANGGVLELTCP
ncbi:MAG TPA: GNAT family N-acetyltransferase [Vicinamibacterales bacterium]|jgi:GNAT superfamily N-acetyltransferase|nr:GNAT family N-acetyltransferase [Vicinamibacterales bacterium]